MSPAAPPRPATHPRRRLIAQVGARLAAAGVPAPQVDARWLVDAVVDPVHGEADLARLDDLVARRAAREPLQLVVGTTVFRWVELACRPGVFIPRPETEIVAGAAIDAARRVAAPARVLEPATGTGAITCALVSEVPGVQVVTGDLDPTAVALARDNLAALGRAPVPTPWRPGPWAAPGASATVVASDLLAGPPAAWRGRVDVLVANPPYLPAADAATWAPEVADHDPRAALVGGADGHELVEALLAAAPDWLAPGGTVVIEIDDRRGPDALAAARRAGLVGAYAVADLTGRDRAVVATRPARKEGLPSAK